MVKRVRGVPTQEELDEKRSQIHKEMKVGSSEKSSWLSDNLHPEFTEEEDVAVEAARLEIMKKNFGPKGGVFRVNRIRV